MDISFETIGIYVEIGWSKLVPKKGRKKIKRHLRKRKKINQRPRQRRININEDPRQRRINQHLRKRKKINQHLGKKNESGLLKRISTKKYFKKENI